MDVKKTSADWCKEFECAVYDPDGWDRRNYEYSFNEELITEYEFLTRIIVSTVKFSCKLIEALDEGNNERNKYL